MDKKLKKLSDAKVSFWRRQFHGLDGGNHLKEKKAGCFLGILQEGKKEHKDLA